MIIATEITRGNSFIANTLVESDEGFFMYGELLAYSYDTNKELINSLSFVINNLEEIFEYLHESFPHGSWKIVAL